MVFQHSKGTVQMLQYTAISEGTLGLLKQLMFEPALSDFYLVGGTALSLWLGHRKSFDIDMFTQKEFDAEHLRFSLEGILNMKEKKHQTNTLRFNAEFPMSSDNWIKVELIRYNYPNLLPIVEEDGIRLLSIEDIIPMKLSSIVNRGVKRDFYDIYFLLEKFSILEMMELYDKKFQKNNHLHVLKSLTYFDDADTEDEPVLLKKTDWLNVKNRIIDSVKILI